MSRKRCEGKLFNLALNMAFFLKKKILISLALLTLVSPALFLSRDFLTVGNVEAEGKFGNLPKQNPGTEHAGGPFRTTPETGNSSGDIHGNVPGSPGKSCEHVSQQGKRHGEPDDCSRPTPTPTPQPTVTPTPTPIPTATPTPTSTSPQPTATPTPTPTSQPNERPECLGLSVNPSRGGAALDVNFTGSGSDFDGKIMAFEFNFGDGQKEVAEKDVGGSGSHSLSHTFSQPGIFQASLRVRDNNGEFSETEESCKARITVEGEVLGVEAVSIQPKTGVATPWLLGLLLSGVSGLALKRFLN